MTAKPYEMWSAAAVGSRLSPVEVTVEMPMETTGRLLNVAGTCRRRHACQLAGVLRGPLRCSDTRRAIGSGPVRTLARWCLVRSLLKEALRLVFQLPYEEAVPTLDAWIGWARRCRIPRFVKLQRPLVAHRDTILASSTTCPTA